MALGLWKESVVKSCDPIEAFGLPALEGRRTAPRGVDLDALARKAGGAGVLEGAGGGFVILGASTPLNEKSLLKVEPLEAWEGRTYSYRAEARQEGDRCVIRLDGAPVYEGRLAQAWDVAASWSPSARPEPVRSRVSFVSHGSGGWGEARGHGIDESILRAFKPEKGAFKILASSLDLSDETVASHFRLGGAIKLSHAIRLAGASNALWFGPGQPGLLAELSALKAFFDGSPRAVPFEVRLDAAGKSARLVATVYFGAAPGDPQSLSSHVTGVAWGGLAPLSPWEAENCVRGRAAALVEPSTEPASASDPRRVEPSVRALVGPCEALEPGLEKRLRAAGVLSSLAPFVLGKLAPDPDNQYQGWDQVIAERIEEDLRRGVELRSDLDPSGGTPILQEALNRVSALQEGLRAAGGISEEGRIALVRMGLAWALRGQRVSPERQARIIRAARSAVSPFQDSTERLLRELADHPEANDEAIAFAEGLSDAYKAEALRVARLAEETGYEDWRREHFEQVLQKRPSLADLQGWGIRIEGIRSALEGLPGLSGAGGPLARTGIRWMRDREATPEAVSRAYAALANSRSPFRESTDLLIRELSEGLTPAQAREALEFAAGLDDAYKRAAVSVRDLASQAGLSDWGKAFFDRVLQKRPSAAQVSAWGSTLQASLEFERREASRLGGAAVFLNEVYRKDLLRLSLAQGWGEPDLLALERIAELGRLRPECARLRGAATAAACIGLELLGPAPGRLLDPAYRQRYGALATALVEGVAELGRGVEAAGLRDRLLAAFFDWRGPLWKSCGEAAFEAKRAALQAWLFSGEREATALDALLGDCRR